MSHPRMGYEREKEKKGEGGDSMIVTRYGKRGKRKRKKTSIFLPRQLRSIVYPLN